MHSIPDIVPPLMVEGGITNLKELNPGTIHTGPFCPTSIVVGGHDLATYQPDLTYPCVPAQHVPGVSYPG
jgi:hypothetical protein